DIHPPSSPSLLLSRPRPARSPLFPYTTLFRSGVSGVPPGATLTPPSPIAPGQSTQFFINTTVSTPPASYTLTVTGKRREASRRRSEEHTSELQSRGHLVCRLLLQKKEQTLQTT